MIERFFGVTANGTTVRTEIIAGATTYLTMAYIVFVNPVILAEAGMDKGAVFVATCLASALATLLMALLANYPLALAPGMGINAYFTYGVVKGLHYSWEVALGAVFLSGCLFLILSVTRIRAWIVDAIPPSQKMAISAGIGLFLFAELDWDDVTEYAPAVVTALAMPLTFSIANGIAFGFISYAAVKLLSGRFAEASPSMLVLATLFIVKYAFF